LKSALQKPALEIWILDKKRSAGKTKVGRKNESKKEKRKFRKKCKR
jgi:hypothetical protein